MDLTELEERVRRLVEKHQALERSHKELKTQVDVLQQACRRLQEKRDLAVTNVEEVIKQLKLLESQ